MYFVIYLILANRATAECPAGTATNGDATCIRCGIYWSGICFANERPNWFHSSDAHACGDSCRQQNCTGWTWTDSCGTNSGCCWISKGTVTTTNLVAQKPNTQCVSWFQCNEKHHRASPGVACQKGTHRSSCAECGQSDTCSGDCEVKDNSCRNRVYSIGAQTVTCTPESPCNHCQGSCTSSKQCRQGLVCLRPAEGGLVEGCTHLGTSLTAGYCVKPCKNGVNTGDCTQCSPGCLQCVGSERCTECGEGYARVPDSNGRCKRDCLHFCTNKGTCTLLNNVPTCDCGPNHAGERCTLAVGNWTDWSTCSATCGGGVQHRTCMSKTASKQWVTCDKSSSKSVEEKKCNTRHCLPPLGGQNDGLGPAVNSSNLSDEEVTNITLVLVIVGVVLLCLSGMLLQSRRTMGSRQTKGVQPKELVLPDDHPKSKKLMSPGSAKHKSKKLTKYKSKSPVSAKLKSAEAAKLKSPESLKPKSAEAAKCKSLEQAPKSTKSDKGKPAKSAGRKSTGLAMSKSTVSAKLKSAASVRPKPSQSGNPKSTQSAKDAIPGSAMLKSVGTMNPKPSQSADRKATRSADCAFPKSAKLKSTRITKLGSSKSAGRIATRLGRRKSTKPAKLRTTMPSALPGVAKRSGLKSTESPKFKIPKSAQLKLAKPSMPKSTASVRFATAKSARPASAKVSGPKSTRPTSAKASGFKSTRPTSAKASGFKPTRPARSKRASSQRGRSPSGRQRSDASNQGFLRASQKRVRKSTRM